MTPQPRGLEPLDAPPLGSFPYALTPLRADGRPAEPWRFASEDAARTAARLLRKCGTDPNARFLLNGREI